MPRVRKQLPVFPGNGKLHFRGFDGMVDYEILGEPTALRAGPNRLRGSIIATPEIAEQAFREGEGVLTLEEGGKAFRIVMLGHSAGSGVAYFEMRV